MTIFRSAFLTLLWLVAAGLMVLPSPLRAADGQRAVVIAPAPRVVTVPPPVVIQEQVAPPPGQNYAPPPRRDVEYGCKRIWRCDQQVCEWRRGCWGIYGYMEGPYYSLPLARSQWQSHGWPTPRSYRQ